MTADPREPPGVVGAPGPARRRARGEHPVVAVCQLGPVIGDARGNLRRSTTAIREAAETSDVVVLPELTNSGYVFRDAGEARQLAEPLDGPTVGAWSSLAVEHELVVVGGLCALDENGRLRNRAVIIDPSGVRAVYDKVHLWDAEPDVFVPGDQPPPVVETSVGRVSTMVCYDVEFPEWVRLAALGGADLLCVPTNWPADGPSLGPFPAEVLRVAAGANTNRIYVAVAARTRPERGVAWVEASGVAGPDGAWLTSLRDGPAILRAPFDVAAARSKWTSSRNHALGDRRPELYSGLVAT